MKFWDRLFRALFVACGVGLGWGIRGDFGHTLGAMAPGATLAMGFAYVSGQRSMFRWMPILAAAGAFFIGLGGMMSYGILHGYAKSDTLANYSYGFACLFLQGGTWGGFGGAAIGMLLDRNRVKAGEWFGCLATAWLVGWLVYLVVVNFLEFDINPPRSNLSIGFAGAWLGAVLWLAMNRKWYGLRGAVLGFIGFGIGMSLGRLLGNATYLQPMAINHWNVMEVSCGFIGGLVFTFGMLGPRFDDPPAEENWTWIGTLGVVYVMGLIPWLHRLRRIDPAEKLEQWKASAAGYGIENPDLFAQQVLSWLTIICAGAFVAAAIWMYLWRRDVARAGAFPVLVFSLAMLLFQNVNALYFWYPARENHINMHTVFWVLFGAMVLFAVAFELVWPSRESVASEKAASRSHLGKWILAAIGIYALTVLLAGFVNSDETMQSANTRFPEWSWRDGPFPRE